MCFKTSPFRLGNLKRYQKSTIYTPKQDDKHVRPCHMPAPAPLPKGVRYFWTSQWLLLCQILHKETSWFVNKQKYDSIKTTQIIIITCGAIAASAIT